VRSVGKDGTETVYRSTEIDWSDEQLEEAEIRTMDCIDCHNRPTHHYYPAAKVINRAISLGRIDAVLTHHSIPNDELGPLFAATVRATEEAIINSMIAARDMTGNLGSSATALPHDALMDVMKRYGR